MSEKELVIKEKIETSGLFDFPAFYGYAHSWLKNEGYGVSEDKYGEHILGNSRNIEIEWKATKELSDYFKVEIAVDIKGILIRDPESKWEGGYLSRFMRDVYDNYIIQGKIDEMKNKVSSDIVSLKEELKAFLDLIGKR